MIHFLIKTILLFVKPKVIIVTGNYAWETTQVIFSVLKSLKFKISKLTFPFSLKTALNIIKSKILIIALRPEEVKNVVKNIPLGQIKIVVVTALGNIPPEDIVFAGEKIKRDKILQFLKKLSPQDFLVLNYDDETAREIDEFVNIKDITFGFDKGADLRVSDVTIDTEGTNFKLNFEGKVIPVWLSHLFGKKHIYAVLAVFGVARNLNINFLEVAKVLKNYQPSAGEGRIIKGVKNTLILDDSKNASLYSMIEALLALKEIGRESRKIAVLGDVIGIGKYSIEAHEAIGEYAAKCADLLFTVGPRAKFIAQGAKQKGFLDESIFSFDTTYQAKLKVQEIIQEGDIILVDGSKEMNMQEIVEEIKEISRK